MDLNIDNYSIDELLTLFNITNKNIDNKILQKHLSKSLSIITNQNANDLSENKDELIDFYTKSVFKILNNQKKNYDENIKNSELSITNEIIKERNINNNLIKGLEQPFLNNYSLNTNNNQYIKGLVNPLERETSSSILSINSKFRDNYSKSSTDFIVELNYPYSNTVSMKLSSIELTDSYYSISQYLKTNSFFIEFFQYNENTNDISLNSIFNQQFIVPDGKYNPTSLVDTINTKLFKNNDIFDPSIKFYRLIQVTYDEIKRKIGFSLYDALNNQPLSGYKWGFNINFSNNISSNTPSFLNFGWLLGYTDISYSFFNDKSQFSTSCKDGYLSYYQHISSNILNIGFNPQAITNLIGTNCFLLEVDDFNKNQSEIFRTNSQLKQSNNYTFNYSIFNVLARIPNKSSNSNLLFQESYNTEFIKRRYFGPVRLSRLKIRLLDEYGIVVNLNNNDIIINLEIEILNSPYKNQNISR